MWSKVQEILNSINIEIQLSYFNTSFGVNYKNKLKSVFNFNVLLVNYYVFPQNINYIEQL